MRVQVLKLITGETVVGLYTLKDNGEHYLKNPVLLYLGRDKNGNPNMNYAPYVPLFAKYEATFKPQHVLCDGPAEPETKNNYIHMTTGLVQGSEEELRDLEQNVSPSSIIIE